MSALTTVAVDPSRSGPSGVSDAEAVALLHQMVAIRSHSGQEGTLAAFLVGRMRRLGLEAHIDGAGNTVGVTPTSRTAGPGVDIVLLGHMDTVPGEIPVRLDDGVLYGRGSVDAKGPLAAFIIGAATAKIPRGVRLVVIGAVEEEAATSKGARFASQSFRPSACIIGEPSSSAAVTLGYKGRLLAEYTLRLPCGHTAGPGAGAAEHAAAWWQGVRARIDTLNQGRTSAFDSVQAGLRSMNTDSDGLHERVRAVVGFRLPPGIAPAAVETICTEVLIAASTAGEAGATLSFTGHEHAYVADRHTPLVRAFTTAIRESGESPRLLVKTGTSDMNVVGPVWNCPTVAYGPGDSSLDHTPHEHIRIDEYLRSIAILRAVLERTGAELGAQTSTKEPQA